MDFTSTELAVAIEAAHAGGAVLAGFFRREPKSWAKTPYEMAGEADIASEQAILAVIRAAFPMHTIQAEESGTLAGDLDHRWIIDPLDGTLKFLLGEPYFSVSIAYEYCGEVEIGVVFNPVLNDLYTACRFGGARRNDESLRIPAGGALHERFVCCDWGCSGILQQEGLRYLAGFLPPATRGIGINFSPALDLCHLAEGRNAAYISNGTTPEDHSAGALIVREAGGVVRNFTGNGWDHRTQGIVAACDEEIMQIAWERGHPGRAT